MIVLAFDTSMRAVSVALATPHGMVRRFEAGGEGPAERLMPMIQAVMAEAGLPLAAVTRFATAVGPGGFTGIRVALATARGFALATGRPLVGVNSLQLMAWTALAQIPSAAGRLIVAADAGRGGVYVQCFDRADAGALDGPRLIVEPARDLVPWLDGALVIGPAAAGLVAASGAAAETALGDLHPDAKALATRASDLTPDPRLRPMYLRSADARPAAGAALTRVSVP